MISHLSGQIAQHSTGRVRVDVNGIGYEVLLPVNVEQSIAHKQPGERLELVIFSYIQIDGNRGLPVLIGFLNHVQKEFFERLLTVPKMGPKAALSAMSLPVSTVAAAIERGDQALLKSLTGIGQQRARDLIATLQGKVARFALLREEPAQPAIAGQTGDVTEEALQMLLGLGHRQAEAQRMIADALVVETNPADAETLVRAVYRRQQQRS